MEKTIIDTKWTLKVRSDKDGLKEHALNLGKNTLGRSPDSDIILPDPAASGSHAVIKYDKVTNSVTIRDLDSTNGTYVNGKQVQEHHPLNHEDQIRIGYSLITIIDGQTQLASANTKTIPLETTRVTGQLILESIDQYGVLLHEVGKKLINMPDLENALSAISSLIKRMVGAEYCYVFLSDQYDALVELGVPRPIIRQTIETQSASTFSSKYDIRLVTGELNMGSPNTNLLTPVVIDQNVVALIFVRKPKKAADLFSKNDLQLILAIGNQVAMSIQRNQVEAELIHKSSHDPLTDLPNRSMFLERLQTSIARSKEDRDFGFAVLFFDLDNFKVVNDGLGHLVGDQYLIAIAERLKHNIRNVDLVTKNATIARLGGDEFALLLNNIQDSDFAVATGNRLIQTLSSPVKIEENQIEATVSVGIALSSFDYEKPEEILRDADMAMYQAKSLGKARVHLFDKSLRNLAVDRLKVRTALKQGDFEKDFHLHYQPIVSLFNREVVGYEALLRRYSPDRTVLNPDDFFTVFDTPELIYSVDKWVLQKACEQAVRWSKELPESSFYMSVNLSANNLKNPNLVQNIKEILNQAKLQPERLWLEITEQASAPDDVNVIEVLEELRSFGINIYLDDFGTGYSALNYLARFPVDGLKIDRSFVNTIGVDDNGQKVIEMIITLAKHLDLVVVAEGVEDLNQVSFLQALSCTYAQGYHFARPMEANDAKNMLEKKRLASMSPTYRTTQENLI